MVHSITFKLTDFVWELSTVLHVELDLTEDTTTTQRSYKFLPTWRKKRLISGEARLYTHDGHIWKS